jgi:hypothetical protein
MSELVQQAARVVISEVETPVYAGEGRNAVIGGDLAMIVDQNLGTGEIVAEPKFVRVRCGLNPTDCGHAQGDLWNPQCIGEIGRIRLSRDAYTTVGDVLCGQSELASSKDWEGMAKRCATRILYHASGSIA